MNNRDSTRALLFSTLAMSASFVVWNLFSPLATRIQEMYGLTTIEKSVLVAAPVLLGSVLRIPMGIYTDRFGGKKTFAATMLFLIVPLLLASAASSYGMLLLCAVLAGMGGTTFAVSLTYVSRWYSPERQGFILGLAGLGNLGVAASSFLAPILVDRYGLDATFRILAVMITVVAAIFVLGAKEMPKQGAVRTFRQSMSVLRHRTTWYLSIYYFLTFGGFVAFSVYLPTLLKELFDMPATEAGLRTAAFVLVATLIRPLGGWLADRIGSGKVLTIVFGGIVLSSLAIGAALHHLTAFGLCCLVTGALLGLGNGAVFQMVPKVSSGNTGAVTGIVGAAGGVGGFFPPIVLGMIENATGTFAGGFVLLALFACLCLTIHYAAKKMKTAGRAAAA
ncbi:nitrate/nitrite transporter [Cohnella faecalis]|nr:MFS transporter [Cohnella faecalis]